MKKALLIDTSRAAYPIYLAMKSHELDVTVIGSNPEDYLARIVKSYQNIDYSDVTKLKALIERAAFDYVVPGCNDLSYASCAEVCDGRFHGIDSIQSTLAINCKDQFRALARNLGIPVPITYDQGGREIMGPVIVKPVDSYSGRGMTVLRLPDENNLCQAITKARNESRSGSTVVEEFVEGQLFSHSAFLSNHQIIADFVVQEDCSAHPFTVDTSRLFQALPEGILSSIRDNVRHLSSHLGLVDGLIHSQIIFSGERYWFIEVTRRCPGDLYSLLIEQSTGYDYARSYLAPYVGLPHLTLHAASELKRMVRKTVSLRETRVFSHFEFGRDAKVRTLIPMVSPSQLVREAPFGRAGVAFFEASSDDEWDELYDKARTQELIWFN